MHRQPYHRVPEIGTDRCSECCHGLTRCAARRSAAVPATVCSAPGSTEDCCPVDPDTRSYPAGQARDRPALADPVFGGRMRNEM